jgi:hypothetical protein
METQTIVPEAFVGGPIALVEEGDLIRFDVEARRLDLEVAEDVLAERRRRWQAPAPRYATGVLAKYAALVSSAAEGAVTRPEAYRGCDAIACPACWRSRCSPGGHPLAPSGHPSPSTSSDRGRACSTDVAFRYGVTTAACTFRPGARSRSRCACRRRRACASPRPPTRHTAT